MNWHTRFGHSNCPAVQRILRQFPFLLTKFAAAAKCDLTDFRCEICQYAKAHRRTTHGKWTQVNEERDGALKSEHLGPGVRVSVDHFESRILWRTRDSYGEPSSDQYKGGCIFVDHGTGYLHVEHQLRFSAVETIRAKQSYENMDFEHGVVVQSYLTDSGSFKANAFVQHICEHAQQIKYCGPSAHHQNGVAERSIIMVSNMARAILLLHSAAHWKDEIDSSLWPLAVSYAVYVYNNTPNAQNLCPADLFTGATVPWHRLRDLYTWGCPVYVLDPTLQAGKKLPRCEPRSRCGVFVWLSMIHTSEVPLILIWVREVLQHNITWFLMTDTRQWSLLDLEIPLQHPGRSYVWKTQTTCQPILRTCQFIWTMTGWLKLNANSSTTTSRDKTEFVRFFIQMHRLQLYQIKLQRQTTVTLQWEVLLLLTQQGSLIELRYNHCHQNWQHWLLNLHQLLAMRQVWRI